MSNTNVAMVKHFFPSFDPDVIEEKEKYCIEPKEQIIKDFSETIRKIINKESDSKKKEE